MNESYITWDISPIIFKIGFISFRWYSLLLVSAIIIGYFWIKKMFDKENVPPIYLDKLSIYVIVGLLIGLRLGHCLFYDRPYYLQHPWEIIIPFKISGGSWEFTGFQGLASHGGAVGVLISLIFYCRKMKVSYIWVLDRLVIVVAFGGLLVRMGNLMNSEIYGNPTDVPWAFKFVTNLSEWEKGKSPIFSPPSHPTQIYEGICYLLLAIGLYLFYLKKNGKPKPGIIFGIFLFVLFVLRFLIEFLKEPQADFELNMALNMGQLLSIPFIIAGIVVLYYALKNKFKSQKPFPPIKKQQVKTKIK